MFGMNGGGQRMKPGEKRGRWSVQEFVANAVDAPSAGGGHLAPASVPNDFLQRDTVTGTTPGRNQDIRIVSKNGFG